MWLRDFFSLLTLVIFEEKLLLRKSKPVLLAAGIIWAMIGFSYAAQGLNETTEVALKQDFLEYSELFFFLLVAMTYVNAMIERDIFQALHLVSFLAFVETIVPQPTRTTEGICKFLNLLSGRVKKIKSTPYIPALNDGALRCFLVKLRTHLHPT